MSLEIELIKCLLMEDNILLCYNVFQVEDIIYLYHILLQKEFIMTYKDTYNIPLVAYRNKG